MRYSILDYSSYRSRVDEEVSTLPVSKVNAFMETATAFGLKTSTAGVAVAKRSFKGIALISTGVGLGIAVIAG